MVFNAVDDVVRAAKSTAKHKGNVSRLSHALNANSHGFYTKTFIEVENDLISVPKDLCNVIDDFVSELRSSIPVPQRRRRKLLRNRPDGDDFCLDKFRDRSYDTMWTVSQPRLVDSRVARIGVNISMPASARPSELLWRGAALCVLTEVYEELGIQTEVTAFDAVAFHYDHLTEIRLKQQHEAYDRNKIAIVACDINFMRRVSMAAILALADFKLPEGQGAPRSLTSDERRSYDCIFDVNIRTKDQAVAFVKGLLNAAHS